MKVTTSDKTSQSAMRLKQNTRLQAEISQAAETVATNSANTINMHDISLHEINTLIKAGVQGLLDIVPATQSLLYGNLSEEDMHIKVDFLGQIQAHIDFKKSLGESTETLQKILENVRNIHGLTYPTKIDIAV